MAKNKKTISTSNREIYEKLGLLNFSSEILLQSVKSSQIEKIVNNINKDKKILNLEQIGNYFIVKKVNPINFDIYYKPRKTFPKI